MYQKIVEKDVRSKKDVAKLRAIVNDIKEARKDPEFMKAARAFVKYHTGSK